ncbi:MAG TPA: TolC family protein [Candidatus Baltobacteraceae bacterium]|jgi:outer membrane protein TolC|nr:TolC family protein [Candidatus Baltobacteraceae bacterium]
MNNRCIGKTSLLAASAAFGAMLMIHGSETFGQSTKPPKKDWVVNAEELTRIALTNNLDIRISEIQPKLDQFYVNGLYGAYEPTLTMNASHSYDSFPSGVFTQAGLVYPATTEQINSYGPGLSGFAPWGLNYSFTGPLSEQNVSGAPDLYSSQPGVTLSQPLLKNLWIDNTRYAISANKNQLKMDQMSLRLQIMTVINNVMAAYYSLIYARENVAVQEMAAKLAEETTWEDAQEVKAGSLAPLDEKQAESQAASSRSDLLAAQASLIGQENALKLLLDLPQDQWKDRTPVPGEHLLALPENPDLEECLRNGMEKRPDMLQAKLALEKQHLTIKYTYNQLFPEIDVVGNYGRNATELTFNSTLNTIQRGDYPFYSYGVVMTIPLGNSGPRNAYKSAKASLDQLRLQFKKTEWSIVTAIEDDVANVQADWLRVDATRQARIFAEEALRAEQTKMEHGMNTSFFVLQTQQTLTSRRLDEIQALVRYNIDVEQLAFDDGTILDRNRIELRVR